ncbi:3'-5' exonuclease [Corynebacterium vitaeruminis]|uniref:3'-5' exonuclease n=1 Tax=Corynebacterium vitaeruminis TaxID=38305 RepID=UPI0023F572BC|nr:3'-5' exonuclease [Corynebacterium vitaeruminis]
MAIISVRKGFKDRYGLAKEILSFIEKLTEDPSSPSLHIEPIKNPQDKRVRTGRINSKYRAVLFEIQGQTEKHFVLVDVLNHDDAYEFAVKARMRTNPVTGVTELLTVSDAPSQEEIEAEIESRAKAYAAEQLAKQQVEEAARPATPVRKAPREILDAAGITREMLSDQLGISPVSVAIVYESEDERTLDGLLGESPSWERDAIIGLLAGLSIEEVREELGLDEKKPETAEVDEDEELIAGLQTPAARMEFVYDAGQEELEAIISTGTFNEWRIFLHPSQESAVRANHSGSARLLGGAGTGKTVVVVHRTNYLLNKEPNSRIFLTTFTRELANALKSQMNLLNPSYQEASTHGARGLWISGIDALVSRVINNAQQSEINAALESELGIKASFRPNGLDSRLERQYWEESAALVGDDLPPEKAHPEFLSQEYSTVILTHGIKDEKSYLRVSRAGRGTPLNRKERKSLWATVQSFHSKCVASGRLTFPALAVIAAGVISHRNTDTGIFDHVLVDEAQDFHAGHWRFIRACVKPGPNDIFLAEDSHQRIYGQRLVLSHFGINTRGRASKKLHVNYRTTAENLHYAASILDGENWLDSDEQTDDLNGYRSVRRGPAPILVHSASMQEEAEKLAAQIREWTEGQENVSIGVLTRSRPRREAVVNQLAELGIDANDRPDANSAANATVSVMTMHNAKGLEFTHVALLDVGAKVLPQQFLLTGLAESEQHDVLQRERALLYVAASRARDGLMISVVGQPSELLPEQKTN